ncbi:MAG TPA: serine hydrolase [Candidatus Moranbacteria bacterium]|nr:serine hydrolase [Candidatus Moranbacteria bacterium]
MSFLATIAAVVIFPLNSLLFLGGSFVEGHEERTEATQSVQSMEEGGQVLGVETASVKQEKRIDIFAQAHYQPVRHAEAADLAIPSAHASLILDAEAGTILHYDQGTQRRQIASLTKIMTAVVVMETVKDLNEVVTVDEEAVYEEGTRIGCPRSGYCISQRLKVGEKVKVRDLLKAMLMNSANDAAVALGKHISGSQEEFAKVMNAKARELGLTDSNFCTPSGLEIDGRESECYSSAYDIARIAAYSLRYKEIWEMFRLPNNTVITSVDGNIEHTILNTDLVMDQIPHLLGGKTGFTPLAGHSLLMVAKDPSGKHPVVAVLLDDPYRWQDIKEMFAWTWRSHSWK